MCFKNLTIEFDEQGNATLNEGVANPYSYGVVDLGKHEDKLKDLLGKNGFLKNVDYDPVTRIAGALAFHSVVDLEHKKVISSNSMAIPFDPTGHSMKLYMPGHKLPGTTMEWHIPKDWNAFERNRARAFCIPYSVLVALDNWYIAQDLMRKGETNMSTPFEIPKKGTQIGVGFWGAGRGFLTHHLIIDDSAIANYQILTPSTLNASPNTPWGTPGPYEEAVLNTPILENVDLNDPDKKFKGIDILRAIRSFDPCRPCTTHIQVANSDYMVTREVITCARGLE